MKRVHASAPATGTRKVPPGKQPQAASKVRGAFASYALLGAVTSGVYSSRGAPFRSDKRDFCALRSSPGSWLRTRTREAGSCPRLWFGSRRCLSGSHQPSGHAAASPRHAIARTCARVGHAPLSCVQYKVAPMHAYGLFNEAFWLRSPAALTRRSSATRAFHSCILTCLNFKAKRR
jgi:hypothetical protein